MAEGSNATSLALEQHLKGMFSRYSTNRKKLLEPQWNRYRANFYRDPTLDDTTWTQAEKDPLRSKTIFDLTKNKVVSAVTIIYDMLTQGGRLALMFMPEDVEQAKAMSRQQSAGRAPAPSSGEPATESGEPDELAGMT